jgi:acetolactate synthase-1/2/3 large subunit
MKASDLLVKCLEEEGIEYIFGVPGEENADFMMSLEKSEKIRFILCRHEQGAAFMADVYGRLTGEPSACLSTLGPGATNLITGVADANMDHSPVLVLTGQGSSQRLHKESHQVMDVVAMYTPVTKWATSILHPDNIPEIVRKAVRVARSEKPGAVLIELPENIAKLQTTTQPIPPRRFRRPAPDDITLDQAFELLKQAKRPMILAGNGCIRKRASKQLRLFCEKTGIGVINTFMGKGSVDMDDERCLFTIGLQDRDVIACALDAADLVLTLGYDMVEYPPRLWNQGEARIIIHADFIPAEIDYHYHPEIELVGDLAHTLEKLNQRVDTHGAFEFDLIQQSVARDQMLQELAFYKDDVTENIIKPQKVLWDVRQVMGPEDILLSDVGAHKMWIARHYQCHEPNTCLISNGFCSMGFALPGAIAAAMVKPERRILAICGDAGFLMNVQEMETAKRLGVNMVVMVWDDREYGLIAWKQQNEFGSHTDLSFNNPDWMQLAQAFGWGGHMINKSTDIKAILEQAFVEAGPSLVIVPIDYAENFKLTERLGNIVCPI